MTDAQSEFVERYAQRGPKGDKGDKGDQGTEGNDATRLPVGQGRAIAYLFVLNLLFVAACFAGLVYYVRAANQERCATIVQIVDIPAAPGSWGARFEAIERNRLRELGCRP